MQRHRARSAAACLLMIGLLGSACASSQQASVAPVDVSALAGKWVGWGTLPGGATLPIQVDIRSDGTYTSTIEARNGNGTIKNQGGKLVAEGHLTGAGAVTTGTGRSELTVRSKGGKQTMEGAGRNDRGPFNFQLTKQ